MAEQELAPLNVQQQPAQVIIAGARPPTQPGPPRAHHPRPKVRKEAPEKLFKWKLKENDGCCSSWCSAHFFLIYLLLENITNIVIAAYHIRVLQDPYGTHEICYHPSASLPETCYDEREFYETAGLSVAFLSVEIGFLCLYVIVCIMTFHALQKCIPWIFMTLWVFINIHVVFVLIHSIITGLYWGVFALLIPMMLSCYFWMLYQLAKYFQQGGVYDMNMSTMSPAPNNYAVIYVAKPDDLAHYHKNYPARKKQPLDHKKLFRMRMTDPFEVCCCQCTQQTWSIIWLVYMILQNGLWFASAVTTTVILYDPYGTWTNCTIYSGDTSQQVDCRQLFETQGLTKAFSIIACFVAGIAIIVNIWCWRGLFTCSRNAFMAQVWMLLIQALFMLLFSIFTGYYFGLFAMLIPMLLSCHFYDVYIISVYCQQRINTNRIPQMQAVVIRAPAANANAEEKQPPPQQPVVQYQAAPLQQPITYVTTTGKPLVPQTVVAAETATQ